MLLKHGALGKQLVEAGKCLIRDAITPVLCSLAANSRDAASLAGIYSALLELGELGLT